MLSRGARRIAIAMSAGVLAMSAVACSAVGGLVEAQSELTKAGYRNPTVRYRPETEVDMLEIGRAHV